MGIYLLGECGFGLVVYMMGWYVKCGSEGWGQGEGSD
jgi:hypothetical protein